MAKKIIEGYKPPRAPKQPGERGYKPPPPPKKPPSPPPKPKKS